MASYVAYREEAYSVEKRFAASLIVIMAITVCYGVLKLRQMQTAYDAQCPPKPPKDKDK
jgi:hypothetical protein